MSLNLDSANVAKKSSNDKVIEALKCDHLTLLGKKYGMLPYHIFLI